MDGSEVLSLGGLDFIGIFWDSVVDDWVVDWSVVVSWGGFVVSVVTAITDLCLGFGDEGEVLGLLVGDFSGVDWDSVDGCWGWLVSVVVVGWGVVVGRGSIVSRGSVVRWGVVSLGLGGSDSGEVEGLFVSDFGSVNWDSIHWCWGISVVGGAFVVVVNAGLGFSDGDEVSVFSGKDFRGLLDWEWSTVSVGVGWNSPVGHCWSGVVGDDWSGMVVWGNGVDWSWSLWQVGGVDDLESVVWVSDVFD